MNNVTRDKTGIETPEKSIEHGVPNQRFEAEDQNTIKGEEEFATQTSNDTGVKEGITVRAPCRDPLSRILSTASTLQGPGPPPDGGMAWVQAAMAHLVICQTWGFISTWGVFQTYYSSTLERPRQDISWIGSIQIFLLFFIGTFSGRALDAGLFRPVYVLGVLLQLLGLFMTSLSTKYWQLFLSQGICMGIGNGLQFCPTMSLVSTYFSKKRSLALGITASGSATGGLIYPAIASRLLPRIGFGWTMRVIGFVTFAQSLVTITFLKTRLPPRKTGPIVEWSALREPPFVLYCIGSFLCYWALYFAFYYVGVYGRDVIGVSNTDSIYLLMMMNGVGYIGRLLPGYVADKYYGPLNTYIPFAFGSGILLFAWSGVHARGSLYAFSCVYGLWAAGIQSLYPAALSSLTADLSKAGSRMGMGFTIVSLATLTGPPLAGALITSDHGNFLPAQMWAGACMFTGGLITVAARITKTGWKLRAKC